jgi:hypothetical protein
VWSILVHRPFNASYLCSACRYREMAQMVHCALQVLSAHNKCSTGGRYNNGSHLECGREMAASRANCGVCASFTLTLQAETSWFPSAKSNTYAMRSQPSSSCTSARTCIELFSKWWRYWTWAGCTERRWSIILEAPGKELESRRECKRGIPSHLLPPKEACSQRCIRQYGCCAWLKSLLGSTYASSPMEKESSMV